MSLKGKLATDEGIQYLEEIVNSICTNKSALEDLISDLSSFFVRHLGTGLLPYSEETDYPSPVQKQVYQWINLHYNVFNKFILDGEFNMTEETFKFLGDIYSADSAKTLAPALAKTYIKNPKLSGVSVLSSPEFQEAVYSHLLDTYNENKEKAFQVLISPFPDPHPSEKFTKLFYSVIGDELTDEQMTSIFDNFDTILDRVDEKLATYDFLHKNLHALGSNSFMAISYLVDVATDQTVDVTDFYQLAFKSITVQSLSNPKRKHFLKTLLRVITSYTLPSNVSTSFAIKLSRYLPLIPIDAQIDVLNLIHDLVKAREPVAKLLEPFDSPIPKVDGEIEECTPQTLWEVRALRNHPVPEIAEAAKEIGKKLYLPPDIGSFNLEETLKTLNNSNKPEKNTHTANWIGGLDKSIWSFR